MTSEQVALVQSSFKSVVPIASKAADLFYDRLFEIAPDVRLLFPAEHYAPVGAALLWTLEQGLGTAFTSDVKVAWSEAYSAVAGAMQIEA